VSTFLPLLAALLLLALLLGGLERLVRGRRPNGGLRRPHLRTDLLWWFSTPLLGRVVTGAGVLLSVLLLALLGGVSVADLRRAQAEGALPDLGLLGLGDDLRALPFLAQFLLGLVVSDFIGYWAHRAFHRGRLWTAHAVHHSSENLDWLASVRVHPLNELLTRVAQAVPLLAIGFDPLVFAAVGPFLTLYALFLHADVDFRFGWLRFVIATPAFHRWHHSRRPEARDKNFAGLFPVWDLLFGTWHLPAEAPRDFGVAGRPVPTGFFGQLAHPFRS
jgi:sterol desaturase/sphingolipid hydroxylase (fatty acid hydroxylase superfamily)